ncbi:MAG: hypothetical protein HQL56_18245, partial [Magnetococcales bacterium]|nr:hypothetical protein [Magnetococcales bacterium]
ITTMPEFRLKARSFANRNFVGKTFVNRDSGDRIEVTVAGVKHALAKSSEDLVRSVVALPELLREARKTATETDKDNDVNTLAVHKYEVGLQIGERSFDVVIVAKERTDGHKYYDHSFKKEKALPGSEHIAGSIPEFVVQGHQNGAVNQGRAQQQDITSPEEGNNNRDVRPAILPDGSRPLVTFDRDAEAGYQRGLAGLRDTRTVLERVNDWLRQVGHGMSRHYQELANTRENARAIEWLRQLEAAPQAAKEEAVRVLTKITDGMSNPEYDLFTRYILVQDLMYDFENKLPLPNGWTRESFPKDAVEVNRVIKQHPHLIQKARQRKVFIRQITDKLVDAGILSAESIRNPSYFRHQVLDYAKARQRAQGTSSVKTPKPGYARHREGTEKDINTNYLEAEFEWLHQAMIDLKMVEAIEKIQGVYDQREAVKAKIIKQLIKEGKVVDEKEANAYLRTAAGMGYFSKHLPEGYVEWQPEKGRHFFVALTLPEHAINTMLEDESIAENIPGVSRDTVMEVMANMRKVLAVGMPKYQMVIPQELAITLDAMTKARNEGWFDHVLATPLTMWKQWVLINPRRVIKYNINNLSGDLDAVIAGNPRALKRLPQAIRELYRVMKGGEPTARYKEAVARGVFDGGLSVQEIPDINLLGQFQHLTDPVDWRNPGKMSIRGVMKVWRTLKDYTTFRENWLRYAAYLDYADRMEANEPMTSIGYGAASPEMVDGLTDTLDKAALLARSLLGDYGAVSAYGQEIRNKVIPFYSWMEINTKRYARLIANSWGQGWGSRARVGTVVGVGITARLAIRMALLYGLVSLFNNLFHGDDEDELDIMDRTQLHLNLGKDATGQIRLLRFQGSLSDFTGWFGFGDAVAAFSEIQKGRASMADVMKAVAKAPFNKMASGITPVIKLPFELAAGMSFWPDIFNPRPIQDEGRHILRLFSLENEYDFLFGKPSRGYGRSLAETVVSKRDPGEVSYNTIKSLAAKWNERERGIDGVSTITSPRANALHDFKRAKRYGDVKAEQQAREAMRRLGVTPEDMHQSIMRANPLGGIALKDRMAFTRTLTPREKEILRRANDWWRETYLQH